MISSCGILSQPQINQWIFSDGNGLDFTSGIPVARSSQIRAWEGAASISDKNGQLLFYTDGISVWDRNHNKMPNGDGLYGGTSSSTQSSVIVPKTIDGLQYYIFTTDEEGRERGLCYSIVDMSPNSGKGDVVSKNIPLLTPVSEKVTAVRHCNKKDYWIVSHQYGSDAYYSYLATSSGVNPVPVVSNAGSFIPVTIATMSGYLKASPDGKRLAAAHGAIGVDLLDFNTQTGSVSNGVEIFKNSNGLHYGVEFSSNSSILYVSVTHYWDASAIKRLSGVFQFDLTHSTVSSIINSKNQLSRHNEGNEMGSLQRGPDGKIYSVQFRKSYLSVIHNPNVYGPGCNFSEEGILLNASGNFSLPNFINDYGVVADDFKITSTSYCTRNI